MTWLVGNKLVTITTSGGVRTQALLGLDMSERLGGGGEMTRLHKLAHTATKGFLSLNEASLSQLCCLRFPWFSFSFSPSTAFPVAKKHK